MRTHPRTHMHARTHACLMVRKSLIWANNILILTTIYLLVSERVRVSGTENQTMNGTVIWYNKQLNFYSSFSPNVIIAIV